MINNTNHTRSQGSIDTICTVDNHIGGNSKYHTYNY